MENTLSDVLFMREETTAITKLPMQKFELKIESLVFRKVSFLMVARVQILMDKKYRLSGALGMVVVQPKTSKPNPTTKKENMMSV
ncbi:MAG: hypothetical protein ACI8RD_004330 [Bacillariaceae sp.]|jgi:hypothetical protein